jgi:YVTN family beta-propeller protein
VGEHPTDLAIAPDARLVVVANRDGRSVSLVDLVTTNVTSVPLPARPVRVAADGNLAAVVSAWDRRLLLIDLPSGAPRTPVVLEDEATGVALDAGRGLAIVSHKRRGRISVVSFTAAGPLVVKRLTLPNAINEVGYHRGRGWALATSRQQGGLLFVIDVDLASNAEAPRLVRTIALSPAGGQGRERGVQPEGIAVNLTTDEVIIVDRGGTFLVYHLTSGLLSQPFPVARGPLRHVAVDPIRNRAVMPGQGDDAFLVDLVARAPLFHVSVGRKPVRAAAGAAAGKAAVVNQDEDSISIFDIAQVPEVGPRITHLDPSSVPAGSGGLRLTIGGSGFARSSVVRFGGTVVPSQLINPGRLRATIAAALVASPGSIPITVTTGNRTSPPALFTVAPPPNPVPVIVPPLLPSNVVAGVVPPGAFLPIVINGEGFLTTSEVSFDGRRVDFGFQSNTQLIALVDGGLVTTPGTVPVTVTNPPPGGGVATAPFLIKPAGNPPGVVSATVDVGAPTSGLAVDAGLGMAVVTHFGDLLGGVGNTLSRLGNLTGTLPVDPPVIVGGRITVGSSPTGAAINPATHVALVSNFLDGTASFVDLSLPTPAELLPRLDAGGVGPQGVAVDPGMGTAGTGVVANRLDGTLAVVDLSPPHAPLAVVPASALGGPVGVAIHPGTHLAVVADESRLPGRAILIDLSRPVSPRVVRRLSVGDRPARVAIDATRHLAVVTNQDSDTIDVISLAGRSVLATLPVGREPFGVAIDESRGIAVVTNRQDATLRLIDLKPASPVVLALSVNLPFIPTEVAVVPGLSGKLRVLTTDVASNMVGVVEIDGSVLP